MMIRFHVIPQDGRESREIFVSAEAVLFVTAVDSESQDGKVNSVIQFNTFELHVVEPPEVVAAAINQVAVRK